MHSFWRVLSLSDSWLVRSKLSLLLTLTTNLHAQNQSYFCHGSNDRKKKSKTQSLSFGFREGPLCPHTWGHMHTHTHNHIHTHIHTLSRTQHEHTSKRPFLFATRLPGPTLLSSCPAVLPTHPPALRRFLLPLAGLLKQPSPAASPEATPPAPSPPALAPASTQASPLHFLRQPYLTGTATQRQL